MKVNALVKNQFNRHEVEVSTNAVVKTIAIDPKSNGYGSSVNGAELLLLSIATCYCNDIYREAAKRNIIVHDVAVEVTAGFGADGEPGTHFQYKPVITADASPEALDELITATDRIAEIHQTLRMGIAVTLVKP